MIGAPTLQIVPWILYNRPAQKNAKYAKVILEKEYRSNKVLKMPIIILPFILVLLMLIITGTCWDKEEFCEKAEPNCTDPKVVSSCPERCGECAKGNKNLYLLDNISWSQIWF